MEIKRITVLGAGLMGHGIAQVCSQMGKFDVNLEDLEKQFVDNGMRMINDSLSRFVNKRILSKKESEEAYSRIHPTTNLKEAVQNVDLIIEAVTENVRIKKTLLADAGRYAPSHTIIASNTSSISITDIGAATGRPELTCGMHFFNPPQLMRLIEIIKGRRTSNATLELATQIAIKLGKEPVLVKKDTPGFVVNRILTPALNEAVYLVANGIAEPKDVDKACELGLNWPMGPLKLLDYIGIDTQVSISEVIMKQTGDKKFRPNKLLKQMQKAKHLGRKTGQGFYDW